MFAWFERAAASAGLVAAGLVAAGLVAAGPGAVGPWGVETCLVVVAVVAVVALAMHSEDQWDQAGQWVLVAGVTAATGLVWPGQPSQSAR